ncbi:lipoprotein-releasing system ATP-binding protein LolD, partial [Escherichia coli]
MRWWRWLSRCCLRFTLPGALPPLNPLRLYVMNKILLQCDNLCKRYQEGSVQTDVLHNVSF